MVLSQKVKAQYLPALSQILAVSARNTVVVAYGMSMNFSTILIPSLTTKDEHFNISAEGLTWIGSIHLICVPVGNLFSGALSTWIGRKRTMQLVNVIFSIAWIVFRFSNAGWQIVASLALSGFCAGLSDASILTYVPETTEPKFRGVLTTTTGMSVIGGVLAMFLLGSFFAWRTVCLVSAIFNVISFTCLFFVPESPHWLISRNRLMNAREALAWLRGWTHLDAIEAEYKQVYREVKGDDSGTLGRDNPAFEIITNNCANTNGNTISSIAFAPQSVSEKSKATIIDTMKLFSQKSFLWPFSLIVTMFFITHMLGISTLQTYAVPIFQTMRAPINEFYATLLLGGVEFLGCVFSTALLHYTGKRLLNFVSILGCGLGFTVVGAYAKLNGLTRLIIDNKNGNESNLLGNATVLAEEADIQYKWVPMTFLILVGFMAQLGLIMLPWLLLAEVFSIETRTHAAGLCCAITYIISFAVNKEYFAIVDLLTLPGTFFMHALMALTGFVILYVFLPETEGRTLGQIREHFAGGAKLGNRVFRSAKAKRNEDNIASTAENSIVSNGAMNGHSETIL